MTAERDITGFLARHLQLHPSAGFQDVVKLCYQAAYGAEHLLSDPAAAESWFYREFEATPPRDIPLCERICYEVCRLNIAGWKAKKLPPQWLFRLFLESRPAEDGDALFAQYLIQAGKLLEAGAAWENFLEQYRAQGGGPVHHSQSYRASEMPAYRIAPGWAEELLPILEQAALHGKDREGFLPTAESQALSQNTVLASRLEKVLGKDSGVLAKKADFENL